MMNTIAFGQPQLLRLTFVDNASVFPPTDVYVDPLSINFPTFLRVAQSITVNHAHVIASQYTQKIYNNTILNYQSDPYYIITRGHWYYRIIKPFDYTSQIRNPQSGIWSTVRRTGTDKGGWIMLEGRKVFEMMIRFMMNGTAGNGCWAEIMHQCQMDRDARMHAYKAINQLFSDCPISHPELLRQPPSFAQGSRITEQTIFEEAHDRIRDDHQLRGSKQTDQLGTSNKFDRLQGTKPCVQSIHQHTNDQALPVPSTTTAYFSSEIKNPQWFKHGHRIINQNGEALTFGNFEDLKMKVSVEQM